jgi:hypothetical protein
MFVVPAPPLTEVDPPATWRTCPDAGMSLQKVTA